MSNSLKIHEKAKAVFINKGGILRTKEAIRAGIHPRILYELLDMGIIERLSRGLYRLTNLTPLGNPDLVSVSMRVPEGIICLISALVFYEITTQIPHEIYIAVERDSRPPSIDYPPVRIFRFKGETFTEGMKTHMVDGYPLRIYSPEKTLADSFKYRNKIGMDTVIEALKLYRERKKVNVNELINYAKICRVEKIMRPYLESII
jgi:predicted transcriptional regulator of viral defense system